MAIALEKIDFFKIAYFFQTPEIYFPKTVFFDKLVKNKRVLVTACQYFDIFLQENKEKGKGESKDVEETNYIWCYAFYLAAKLYASSNIADLIVNSMLWYTASPATPTFRVTKEMIGDGLRRLMKTEKECIPILARWIQKHGRFNVWEWMQLYHTKQDKNKIWPYVLFLCVHVDIAEAMSSLIYNAIVLEKRIQSCKNFELVHFKLEKAEEAEMQLRMEKMWPYWNKKELLFDHGLALKQYENEDHIWNLFLSRENLKDWKHLIYMYPKVNPKVDDIFLTVERMISYCQSFSLFFF